MNLNAEHSLQMAMSVWSPVNGLLVDVGVPPASCVSVRHAAVFVPKCGSTAVWHRLVYVNNVSGLSAPVDVAASMAREPLMAREPSVAQALE